MEINGKSVEFDFSKTNLGDWDLVMRGIRTVNAEDFPAWVQLLERILIGGKDAFPMPALNRIIREFYDRLPEESNPKAPAA